MARSTLFALLAVAAACGGEPPRPQPTKGTLVLGVQAQPGLATLAASYRVRVTVAGEPKVDALRTASGSTAALPFEARLEGTAGAEVAVTVEGYGAPDGSGTPLVTRRARAALVVEAERLLRVRLETACASNDLACPTTQTCARGRCTDPLVTPDELESYRPAWAVDEPDACKPANAGAPEVIVGTGQNDYAPLVDGQTLEAERGPQGGHHLWIAVRLRNVKQAGTTVTVTARQPGSDVSVPPTGFVFGLETDEGGYCKLYGLRFQLDNGGTPIADFLGKPLDVTVTARDVTGTETKSMKRVTVATTLRG